MHFYIIKNLFYVIKKFMQELQELKESSLLLHSFASDLFGSKYWCTLPLTSMSDILLSKKINLITLENNPDLIKDFIKLLIDEQKKRTNCYVKDTVNTCIDVNDIKNLWKQNEYNINITYGILQISPDKSEKYINSIVAEPKIMQSGGNYYYYKYIKYKYKYNKLNYFHKINRI